MLTTEVDDIYELKEAIIELYLAIKIRSTEEVGEPTLIHFSYNCLPLPLARPNH